MALTRSAPFSNASTPATNANTPVSDASPPFSDGPTRSFSRANLGLGPTRGEVRLGSWVRLEARVSYGLG